MTLLETLNGHVRWNLAQVTGDKKWLKKKEKKRKRRLEKMALVHPADEPRMKDLLNI